MTLYIVVGEDDDGMWWDDPEAFDNESEAQRYCDSPNTDKLPDGYEYVIYRCVEVPRKAPDDFTRILMGKT